MMRVAPTNARTSEDAALDALAEALAPRLARLLDRDRDGAEMIDVVKTIPASKRALMRACRSGAIVGAVRLARRWLAPRAAVEAWLRALGPRPIRPKPESDDLDALRTRLTQPVARRKRKHAA